MKIKKPVLTAITAAAVCILAILTFFSRMIMTSGQASVQAVSPERTEIYTSKDITGEVQYENTQQIVYDVPLKITDVFAGSGDSVENGEVIMEIDNRELAIELKKRELEVMTAKNRLEASAAVEDKLLGELRLQLEIAEEELALFTERYPADGKIRAKMSGTIYSLNAAKGETMPPNTVLANIYDQNSRANLIFYLTEDDAKYFSEGDSAILRFAEKINSGGNSMEIEVKKNSSVSSKQFILKDSLYKCTVPIQSDFVWQGQQIGLQIINKSDAYDIVIPSQALNREADDSFYIFIIKPRDGIWGEEYYTEKVNVNVLFDNGVKAAVSETVLLLNAKVVAHSSRPLAPGEIVEFKIGY
ncbi:MAG: efflux RND transporter periplasmic adaptor subunit [Oscillospiraceae bacterium]|nr:efflux RND transporter periplasmic adaptor subunit [Oscillospiraceae bacterium]